MIEKILFSILAFVLFLATHWLLFHFKKPARRFRMLTRLFLLYGGLYTALAFGVPGDVFYEGVREESMAGRLLTYGNGLLLYIFLFFSYAQFYFLIDRGISARIMVELLEKSGGRSTFEELKASYHPERLLQRRFDDMVYGGYLVFKDGAYILTAKGRLQGRVFRFFKRFLHFYPGG